MGVKELLISLVILLLLAIISVVGELEMGYEVLR